MAYYRTSFSPRIAWTRNVKPPLVVPFDPGLVAPEWRQFWRNPYIAMPFPETGFNYARNELYTLTSLDIGSDIYGKHVSQNSSTDHMSVGSPPGLTAPISAAVLGEIISVSGSNTHVLGFYKAASPNTGWGLTIGIASATDVMNFWDGTAWRESNTVIPDGDIHLFGFSYDGSNVDFYLDGLPDGSVGTGTVGAYSGAKELFCRADAQFGCHSATYNMVLVVNDYWTASQWAQLAQDPFGPFRLAEQPVAAFVPAAAVGPTVAHYAYPMRVF